MEKNEGIRSFEPASLCDSFNAGNLKKINRNSEPSKKHDTKASTSMFVSVECQYNPLKPRARMKLPRRIYLRVDFVVFTVDSASSCWSSAAFLDASRWLAP